MVDSVLSDDGNALKASLSKIRCESEGYNIAASSAAKNLNPEESKQLNYGTAHLRGYMY